LKLLLLALAACGGGPDPTNADVVHNEGLEPVPDAGAAPTVAAPDAGGGAASAAPSSGIFPPDSPWNTRIDNAPVDPRSDAYIAAMGADDPLVASWDAEGDGLPYVEVPGNQQKVPVSFWGFPDESEPGPYPIPWNSPVAVSADHHVIFARYWHPW